MKDASQTTQGIAPYHEPLSPMPPRAVAPSGTPSQRAAYPRLVALILLFGLIPTGTVALFVASSVTSATTSFLPLALIPGSFMLWHIALADGTLRGWAWARNVCKVWVALSFPATFVAAIPFLVNGDPGVSGIGAALALLLAVAAAIMLTGRRR